ncbi:hypothetical protein KCU88_g3580, partial [Aureobasidium melanogenum]
MIIHGLQELQARTIKSKELHHPVTAAGCHQRPFIGYRDACDFRAVCSKGVYNLKFWAPGYFEHTKPIPNKEGFLSRPISYSAEFVLTTFATHVRFFEINLPLRQQKPLRIPELDLAVL